MRHAHTDTACRIAREGIANNQVIVIVPTPDVNAAAFSLVAHRIAPHQRRMDIIVEHNATAPTCRAPAVTDNRGSLDEPSAIAALASTRAVVQLDAPAATIGKGAANHPIAVTWRGQVETVRALEIARIDVCAIDGHVAERHIRDMRGNAGARASAVVTHVPHHHTVEGNVVRGGIEGTRR